MHGTSIGMLQVVRIDDREPLFARVWPRPEHQDYPGQLQGRVT